MQEKNSEDFDLFRVIELWGWRHTILMIVVAIAAYFWINEPGRTQAPGTVQLP